MDRTPLSSSIHTFRLYPPIAVSLFQCGSPSPHFRIDANVPFSAPSFLGPLPFSPHPTKLSMHACMRTKSESTPAATLPLSP